MGKLRANLGHPKPWTDTFKQITIEYGNEAWNTLQAFLASGSDGRGYWHDLTEAAHGSPYYTSNISMTIGGQAASKTTAQELMFEFNTNADAYCTAPYVMDSYYKNDLTVLTNVAQEFAYFLAFPIWKTTEWFALRQGPLLNSPNFEYKFYEYNYHTTHGETKNPEVAERVARFNGSRAHGISLINFSLFSLKEYGVNRQCLFKATKDGVPKVKLWCLIPDFRKESLRARPVWWAFQAVNQVRHGALVETIHSIDPSVTVYGNFSRKSPRPDRYKEKTYSAVYSYAFKEGNTNGLVLINYDLKNSQTIKLALNGSVLNREATCTELASDSYVDHNDDPDFPNKVRLETTTIQDFQSGAIVELPVCGMKVLQWISE